MILVIDNFDSFTFNLVQYLGMCQAEVRVFRNNAITVEEIEALRPEGIMLSPGPCTPRESGVCLNILETALAGGHAALDVPIFGVCLGHQAIAHVSGGVVEQAGQIKHGKASLVEHDGQGLFAKMRNPFSAIRYHSLVVRSSTVPAGFIATAHSLDDHEIMGLRHERLPIEGVQFHPESVLTENGLQIVQNFVDWTRSFRAQRA
ncbi:MAG: aminodeoxychorismate/anthranilate synthase component II [Chthonomonas sp.]|nr:aminodeoxychorismate/anthranilate synthase component II [Chthonomonas sp.]